VGEGVSLVREPDAGDLHVRFDERRLETDGQTRTEAPAPPVNSYSPRHASTAPVVDSTHSIGFALPPSREIPTPHHSSR
jgi:hypothetical protein